MFSFEAGGRTHFSIAGLRSGWVSSGLEDGPNQEDCNDFGELTASGVLPGITERITMV
jgi:hypothetical protein